jgi:hypothetical protein
MLSMGALTESEIFDRLSTSFRLAAEHCEALARLPKKGPSYKALRSELKLIEGASRQASAWREDTRWLKIGLDAAEAHRRAGDWLRGIKMPDGSRRMIRHGELHPLFMMLAGILRYGQVMAEKLRTRATGRIGMILPAPLPGPHRDTRPVQVLLPSAPANITAGGIIIPDSATLQ